MKTVFDEQLAGRSYILRRTLCGEGFRHLIKMARTLLTITSDARLIAHARREIPDNQANGQHNGER
ncbi:hypothetical protein D3C75_697910 [compost metagenome]